MEIKQISWWILKNVVNCVVSRDARYSSTHLAHVLDRISESPNRKVFISLITTILLPSGDT